MPLRILQIDTERGWRGGQRQTLLLTQALRRHGHQCAIVARRESELAHRARSLGIEVIDVSPWTEVAPLSAATVRRFIRRVGIQIVHAQASHALTLGALAAWHTTARLIVTRHLARPPRANVVTRWKYKQVAGAIAVSDAAANTMDTSGIARERIEVVPGGVELHRAPTPAPAARLAQLGVSAGPAGRAKLVVFIGALVQQKDPITFVRAIGVAHAAIPNMQALIVGDGPLRGDVERAIRDEQLSDVVHLAGFRDDVDALLSAADVLVLSSIYEGLPLVIMDAFVLGVPVVATAGKGIPEAVTDGRTGLLTPVGDPKALGDAVARVLGDPALAKRLADGGRAEAPNYSIDRTAERTLAVYERVLRDESAIRR